MTTDDGHWVVIDGRRWRATDPEIPEPFRRELVDELMAARREVGTRRRAHDAVAERDARDRVQQAKVALGERGTRGGNPDRRGMVGAAARGGARAGRSPGARPDDLPVRCRESGGG